MKYNNSTLSYLKASIWIWLQRVNKSHFIIESCRGLTRPHKLMNPTCIFKKKEQQFTHRLNKNIIQRSLTQHDTDQMGRLASTFQVVRHHLEHSRAIFQKWDILKSSQYVSYERKWDSLSTLPNLAVLIIGFPLEYFSVCKLQQAGQVLTRSYQNSFHPTRRNFILYFDMVSCICIHQECKQEQSWHCFYASDWLLLLRHVFNHQLL